MIGMKMTTMNLSLTTNIDIELPNEADEMERAFEAQKMFQRRLTGLDEVKDDPEKFSQQIVQLVEELGELLQADKRWREYRGDKFNEVEKEKELADVFIVAMNLAIFSGVSYEKLVDAIKEKIGINFERICGDENVDID